MRIPADWITPYYVQVEGQERQQWVCVCKACRCKLYGKFASVMHLRSPRHQVMLRKWMHACKMAQVQASPVINFVA